MLQSLKMQKNLFHQFSFKDELSWQFLKSKLKNLQKSFWKVWRHISSNWMRHFSQGYSNWLFWKKKNRKKKYNFFSDYVEDLLHESQEEFHTLMKRTYGILYEENKDIFEKFFSELTKFLIRGKGDLIKSTHSLFSTLALKMFKVRAFGNLFWTKIEFRGEKKGTRSTIFSLFFSGDEQYVLLFWKIYAMCWRAFAIY